MPLSPTRGLVLTPPDPDRKPFDRSEHEGIFAGDVEAARRLNWGTLTSPPSHRLLLLPTWRGMRCPPTASRPDRRPHAMVSHGKAQGRVRWAPPRTSEPRADQDQDCRDGCPKQPQPDAAHEARVVLAHVPNHSVATAIRPTMRVVRVSVAPSRTPFSAATSPQDKQA